MKAHFKIDKSYFKSKRGINISEKLQYAKACNGKVHTRIVKNCFASELIPILSEFSRLCSLIDGIENSKCYAKHRLSKFKGIKKRISYFILKSANLDVILKLHKKIYIKNY